VDKAFEIVAEGYRERAESEDELIHELPVPEVMRRADEFLLPVGQSTATFLNLLVKEAKSRNILEVGTSFGYSTLWLAEGARATGGKVATLEIRAAKAEYARRQMGRAGLADQVQFHVGDAIESIQRLTGPFDFVLIDLWKHMYVPVFDLVYPKLSAGAIIVADNMIIPEAARADASAYRQRVRSAAHMTSILLPIGSGIEVSRYRDP
jgi:predicted O-methyltransferase YrrM